MPRRILPVLTCLLLALVPSPAARAGGTAVDEATAVSHGIRLSVSLSRRPYPRYALVTVSVTLQNVSHRTYWEDKLVGEFCAEDYVSVYAEASSGPALSLVPPALDYGSCAPSTPYRFGPGSTIHEREHVVLLGSRLTGFTLVNAFAGTENFGGVSLQTPTINLTLQPARPASIRVQQTSSRTCAVVPRPTGAHGPILYEGWPSYNLAKLPQPAPLAWYTIKGTRICITHTLPPSWWFIAAGWSGYPIALLHGDVPRGGWPAGTRGGSVIQAMPPDARSVRL